MRKFSLKHLKLSLNNYYFRPRWSLTIITLILLALFLRLGFWQLARAEEKQTLQQRFESRLDKPPISLDTLPYDPGDWDSAAIVVTGTYDNAHNIYLDNKIYQHRIGYEILTPMYISGKKRTVLINRGWVAAPSKRSVLPAIAETTGEQTINGSIYVSSQKSLTLKNISEPQNTWPLRVQTVDIADLEKRLNTPLYSFIIRLDADQTDGFVRDWQPINMPPHKHVGYAVQWFTFALVLTIIFIALNIRKRRSPK